MITNMHIAPEWRQFMLNPSGTRSVPNGRYATVCGKRTMPKFIGIPGVTGQPAVVDGKAGWCPKCASTVLTTCVITFGDILKSKTSVPGVEFPLWELYTVVAEECKKSLNAL